VADSNPKGNFNKDKNDGNDKRKEEDLDGKNCSFFLRR
jgi:hypothetical protein